MKHLFFSLVLSSAAFATDYSWNNPNHSNWNVSTNWTPNGIPNGATDTATFGIVFSSMYEDVDVTGTFEVQSVTFGNNMDGLNQKSGAQLRVNTSITLDATSTGGVLVGVPIEFITNPTITITNLSNIALLFKGVLSGTPDLILDGPGIIQMENGGNTFSGTVTINPNAELGAWVQALSTNNVINNGLLYLDNFIGAGPIYGGTISGSGSVTIGLSPITLSGANSYTGGTTIMPLSTLIVNADNNLGGPNGPVALNTSSVLETNGSFTINSNRVITLNAFHPSDSASISANGTLTVDGQIVGTGGIGTLNISGTSGTIILTNPSNSQGANSIKSGMTLQVGSDGALGVTTQPSSGAPTLVSMANNSTFHTTGTFTSNRTFQTPGQATLDVDGETTLSLGGVPRDQGSPGEFVKEGTGTLALTGANTYTGGTTVNAGVLQGTTTSLQGDIDNSASVVFDQTTTGTYAGVMSGPGSLTKSNTGTVNLTGVNTYSGGTSVTDGTLQVGSDTNLGNASGNVTLSNSGILKIPTTFTSNRTFQSPNSGIINVDGGTILTLAGVLQDDGTPGTFVKEGSGTLLLTGTNTYSGGTTVSDGVLQGTTTTLQGNIVNNASVVFDQMTTGTYVGVMSGTGTLTKSNTGTVILSNTNTYSGGTFVTDGILQISSDNHLGNASGAVTLSNSGALKTTATFASNRTFQSPDTGVLNVDGGTTLTLTGILQDDGTPGEFVKDGMGTLVLSGSNTYTGGTTVSDGVLQGTTTGIQGNVTNNASVVFDQMSTGTYSGIMSGTGSLTKQNTGTVILSGVNTYSGGTSVTGGTLQVGADSNLGNAASDVTLSSSAALKTTGTFTSNRTFQTPNTGVINVDGGTTLTLAGVLQDDGAPGKFVKEGMGTLAQSGSNTYSGGTSITDGTLQVSADDNLGSASGDVTLSNSGALKTTATFASNRTFQSPDTGVLNIDGGTTLTLAGVLQNDGTPGAFVKEGMGTLLLTAANTYTGGTTISAGVLQGTTTSLQGNVVNNASVIFDQTTTGTYAGVMSGAGSLTKSNTGTVILTGVSSYSGGTSVTQGTLQISADHNLGRTSGAVRLTNSGVLNTTATFSSNRTFQTPNAGVFNVDGGTTLSLTGVLQDDGTPGQFIKDGAGTLVLTGTNTYSAGTIVNDGVLQGTTTGIQGDVTNGASVIFDQTTTGTYAGVMSGTGSLTKSNTGIVALTGTNTYSGGTSVTGGALQVEADSNLGDASGDVSLSNSGALKTTATFTSNRTFQSPNTGVFNVDGGTTLTLSGVLQDDGTPGRFTKNGEGTLVLSGSNTHSNGTTVSQGILQVGADNNLGNASGIVTLANSSVLNTTATFSSNRTFQTPDIGVFDVDGGTTLTLTGLLQDQGAPGKFFKEGTGTLVLTGANTYSNGTTVTGGVLQGTTTGIQGDVLNNASVVFDQASNGTYSGVISGTGSLTKANTGTVILTGANSYSGGTMVNDGVLQGNMTSLQGVITNDATLVFNERGVKPFKGSLEGTGVLNKQNRGIVLLNGAHPFTGTTNLNVGGIRLHGSITGPVNVGVMGAFGGNAQTGDLTNAGLVVPGASIGTITVIGNYVQTSTGNLAIQINDSGASDLLSATGTASLDGRLVVEALPGLYDGNETYTILTAVGGIGGTTFAQEFAIGNLIYQLNYLPNSVVLSNQYVGPILPIAPRDLKGNPKKVAEYLFCPGLVPTNPDLLNVMGALLNLSPDEFIAALDRLHPAQFGALPLVVLQNSHTMANTMVSTTVNMHDCQTCRESSCPPQDGQTLVWITPVGQWQSQKATDDQLGFNTQTYGGGAGVSHLFSSWINLALGGGYSHTDLGWKHNAGDGHWNSIYLGPSVGLIGGNWFVNFLAQGAVNFFSMDRKINFPGIKRTAHNTHHSYDILGRFDGGYQFVVQQPSPFFFVPTFRLGYLNIFEESYTESGADSINLAVDSKYSAFLQPEVLMRMRKEVYTENLCIVPKFELGWISNIPLSSGNYTSSFYKQDLCSSDFSVRSFHDTTNQFVIGLGLTIIRMGNFQFDMGYQARLFDKVYINSAQLSFEKAF